MIPVAYLRISDDAADHPKLLPLSDGAFRLWFNVNCWCAKHLTDGEIPKTVLAKTHGFKPTRQRELITAGLWCEHGSNVQVHDFLVHNDSSAVVKERRKRAQERLTRWRERRRNALETPLHDGDETALVTPPLSSPLLSSPLKEQGGEGEPPAPAARPVTLVARQNPRIVNPGAVVECWDFTFRDLKAMAAAKWPDETERYAELLRWMDGVDAHLRATSTLPREKGSEFWPARFRAEFGSDAAVPASDAVSDARLRAALERREAKRQAVTR